MNAASAPSLRAELDHLLLHPLVLADARVLVRHHAGVDVEPRDLLVQPRDQFERVRQLRRRGAELPAEASEFGDLGNQAILGFSPGLLRGIDVGEIPLVFVRNLAAIALLRENGRVWRDGCEGGGERDAGQHVTDTPRHDSSELLKTTRGSGAPPLGYGALAARPVPDVVWSPGLRGEHRDESVLRQPPGESAVGRCCRRGQRAPALRAS